MISKILKFQLFAVSVLSAVSIYIFFYKEFLPDYFITISSRSNDVSTIQYYIFSALASIEFYSGLWMLFGFIIFLISYVHKISKRNDILDLFVSGFLLMALGLGFYIFYPYILGRGLYFYLLFNVPYDLIVLSFVLFFTGFLYFVFRNDFFYFFKFLYNKLINIFSSNGQLRQSHKKYPSSRNALTLPAFQNFHVDFKSVLEKFKIFAVSNLKRNSSKKRLSSLNSNDSQSLNELHFEDSSFSATAKGSNDISQKSNLDDVAQTPDKEPHRQEVSKNLPVSLTNKNDDDSLENCRPKKKIGTKLLKKRSNSSSDSVYYNIVGEISDGKSKRKVSNPNEKYFHQIIERIEHKLSEFNIDGHIINILKGPVVDTFELELGQGVKVSKVTSSAEDLSLALYGAPIRIVYPMKGRTTVGIEVPRSPREIIYLDEVLSSTQFNNSKYQLPLAMGKDAFGEPFIVNLADMPHMLVAGATGAGKSVFINTILVSLLVKKSPRQMKLILIDPKQLELALYARLPHLIMPVITDAKTASVSLMWAVQEMERRYSILKEFGVRNIDGFNEKLKSATPEMLGRIHHHYEENDSEEYELPFIVVIVDEFADLILTKAGKEIENNICRLAAKARAAGIHLILATQRPSVDVITGLIKSNFPTRVSFRVTTSIDSRTILNAVGAEKLLGKGDMLYKFQVEMNRVHSSYVDENEIEALMDKLAELELNFDSTAMEFIENGGEVEQDPYAFGSHINSVKDADSSSDSLYDQAVQIVMEHRSASASMLQRRLKVGYNRAANLVEEMERKGVVGPAQGSKPRKVLASIE